MRSVPRSAPTFAPRRAKTSPSGRRDAGGDVVRLLADLWAGRVPLADAFWSYTVFWGFIINLAATLASLALVVGEAPNGAVVAAHVAPIPWNVLVLVAVWRSAGRAPIAPGWVAVARAFTLAWVAVLSLV